MIGRRGFDPRGVGWRLGRAREPRAGALWVPWDRTVGVIGPQGSGKTLDLLTPALLSAPGAALVTLTKVEDLLLSVTDRSSGGRPCVVVDPFGLAEGAIPELAWDPVAGCVNPLVAERRAKAFTAGTGKGAIHGGAGGGSGRVYAAEAAKVVQAFFHAAGLTGESVGGVVRWVGKPGDAGSANRVAVACLRLGSSVGKAVCRTCVAGASAAYLCDASSSLREVDAGSRPERTDGECSFMWDSSWNGGRASVAAMKRG